MAFSINRQADEFLTNLGSVRLENVFNPYSQLCVEYDKDNAPNIRRRNLQLVLESAMRSGVDSVWVARDLGFRGGRRTGLPLTDEPHLLRYTKMMNTAKLVRATRGSVVGERTATSVWNLLMRIGRPVFLWNLFPLHPHHPKDQMSNRNHTKTERMVGLTFLEWIIATLRPNSVVGIGRDAQLALLDLGITPVEARHPSYGGQSSFNESISKHYGLLHFDCL